MKQIVSDINNKVPYKPKKIEQSCIELTVNNAQTIENQMKIRNNNFLIAAVDFNKVNISAANQNKLIFILNYLIWL